MRVVDVSVDTEHLAEYCLAVSEEIFRESCTFAEPIVTRENRLRRHGCGWTHCNWSVRSRCTQAV